MGNAMSDILNELLTDIMMLGEESLASKEAKAKKLVYLGFGNYGPTKGKPATHTTDRSTGKLVTIKKQKKSKVSPKEPSGERPAAVIQPSTPAEPSAPSISSTIPTPRNLPGAKGVLDAVTGITTVGSAGAGTPESRAAEASVVLISSRLLENRKSFKGDMDSYLRKNNDAIDKMITQLVSLKSSKLTNDWIKSVKAQIVVTLSQTEKQYGPIESLVWDNAEGRASMKLPRNKDMNDRSDLYIKTVSGAVIGVSLKKSGNIFLANQGYAKIIGTIETFTEDPKAKSKIQSLKKLHKQEADKSFAALAKFLKSNAKEVQKALSKFDRTGVKSLSSPKYDIYFNPNGTLTKKFLNKVVSGDKLASNEFKALLKSLEGVKKENPSIKKVMDSLREVDRVATKQFLNTNISVLLSALIRILLRFSCSLTRPKKFGTSLPDKIQPPLIGI